MQGSSAPNALLLVWLHGFDLVRATDPAPVIRIDGRDAHTGSLPGARMHRRRLIKYAAPLCSVELNRKDSGAVMTVDSQEPAPVELNADGQRVVAITARQGTTRITGGTWSAPRNATTVDLALAVRRRWKPGPLPLLMRLVTAVMPVFRGWPITYRRTATAFLGQQPTMISRWKRTTTARGCLPPGDPTQETVMNSYVEADRCRGRHGGVGVPRWLRPWQLTWGATPEKATRRGYLALVPGVPLASALGVANEGLVIGLAAFAFANFGLALWAARAQDRLQAGEG